MPTGAGCRRCPGQVELGRDGLAELPICRSMGSQPLSQMGRDAPSSAPSAVASSELSDVAGPYAAATPTIICAEPSPRSAQHRENAHLAWCESARLDSGHEIADCGSARLGLVSTEGSGLHETKQVRCRSAVRAIEAPCMSCRTKTGLQRSRSRRDEYWPTGGEFWSVIAHLVCVRKDHVIGLSAQ